MTAGMRTLNGAPAGRRDEAAPPPRTRARRRARTVAAVALTIGAAAGMQAVPASAAPPSFSTPVHLDSATNSSRLVVIRDLNGDGVLDLATASQSEGIGIHLGTGGGAFGPVARYAAPRGHFDSSPSLTSLAGGDLDGDGDVDLVASNASGFTHNDVVWLNAGNGTFGPGTFVALNNPALGCGASSETPCQAEFPFEVVIGDFDEDGKPDLATTAANRGGTIAINRGNGDGTFAAPTQVPFGGTAWGLARSDVDGDGHLDLLAVNRVSAGAIKVFRGNGDGTFAAPTEVDPGIILPDKVYIADLDADGKLDLVVSNTAFAGRLSVLLGNGSGGFGAATVLVAGQNPSDVSIGDFNDDSKLDIAVALQGTGAVAVYEGDGIGGFSEPTTHGLEGVGPRAIDVADLDGDSLLDVVTANINNTGRDASVLLNTTRLSATSNGVLEARVPGYLAIEGGSAGFGNVLPKFTETNYVAHTSLKVATTSASGVSISVAASDPANTNLGGLGTVRVRADIDLNDGDDLYAWFPFTSPVPFYRSTGPVNTTTPDLFYLLTVPAGRVLTRGQTYSQPVTYTAASTIP